ncbi:acylphosphatase [Vibrio sp. JC009]|uniref:acylphosphatase n=1 Tax=Vibrio sp. JC009 TaxID=2912314 RepID=UPI0023AF4DE7|nr:acylphosphatase [Vibrio sp. JC009]WED23144.1 acylphosphatase [Vibrio sp. JC009]
MTKISYKFTVTGMVQGVGFRYHTCHEGLKRGLTGYARNLDNGDVEVVACGSEDQLEDFIQWLKVGPRSAHVSKLIWDEVEFKAYKGFNIMY